ncbi:hypothetical protein LBMAG53_07410 [Planctomycetota bacterium]|nr:hypothetical protein LBMAG53_07410 [Planctomycetota bacterium]
MSNPNPNPLRRLPGWALLLIAVGLVLFIAVVTVATWAWASHRAGQLEWQETVAELESKGFACSPQKFLKMYDHEIDEDLLDQYKAWEGRAKSLRYFDYQMAPWLGDFHRSARDQNSWWGVHPPKELVKKLEDVKPLLDDLISLLRTEKLQISELPGLRQALASTKASLTKRVFTIWTPDLAAIRGASNLLCHKVLIDDALPALRDLDLFDRALSHGKSFYAVQGHHFLSNLRDSAWLGALVHKRIDSILARN